MLFGQHSVNLRWPDICAGVGGRTNAVAGLPRSRSQIPHPPTTGVLDVGRPMTGKPTAGLPKAGRLGAKSSSTKHQTIRKAQQLQPKACLLGEVSNAAVVEVAKDLSVPPQLSRCAGPVC